MKRTIYETKGRAKEFCELAMNHYSGCSHGCTYCYAPGISRTDRLTFKTQVRARVTPDEMQDGIARWHGIKGSVLLCFMTDPYQPIDEELGLTRTAIKILHLHSFPVTILTKAGLLAQRDIDLLGPSDAFATTLTFDKNRLEPRAGSHRERLSNLQKAKERGIQTWASLEPVIDSGDTLRCIRDAYSLVNHFKIGKMNYGNRYADSYWLVFANAAIDLCTQLGARYYIKEDLAKYLGHAEGFWGGPE